MTSLKSSKKPSENSSKNRIDQLLKKSIALLADMGVDAPRTDTLALLETVLGKERTWILAHDELALSSQQQQEFDRLLARRLAREPLAYITKLKDFYGLAMSVNADVLIPRPETEALVEWIIEQTPKDSAVLDVGTGSGAIAIAVKKQRPDLDLTATDVSEDALKVAQINSGQHGTNIKFVHSNLLNYITNSFDVIAANLPYVPAAVDLEAELAYEPQLALRSGSDGLDLYRQFFAQAPSRLQTGGSIIIEHDPSQLKALVDIGAKYDLSPHSVSNFVTVFERSA